MLRDWKFTLFVLLMLPFRLLATGPAPAGDVGIHDVTLTIHLRGVYESKISLMTHTDGTALMQTFLTRDILKNGDTATLTVPAKYLPGEFVVRFDYKEEMTSNPYPSEKRMIINQQNIELWVHPLFSNNPDSTRYQDGELENTVLAGFMAENFKQKEVLGMLQNFLLNYDDLNSDFYQEGINEYEKRRKAHNIWINEQVERYRDMFAATFFGFQLVPDIKWKGTEAERQQSLIDHYFDFVDLNDSLLIVISEFKSWMDQYVNFYGEQAITYELRDSLFTLAGQRAIEEAKKGHPKVYGWMVDYFYKGYESFNIEPGIAMLAPYLDDPNCLTSKKQAILKRIEGMKTLLPGTLAPDFKYTDEFGNSVQFHRINTGKPYKLVLFWSADCEHCEEMVNKLSPWSQLPDNQKLLDVFAISLDETETEVAAWQNEKKRLTGWNHMLANGGVNSIEANSYYILATPVMILVEAKTNFILAMPESIDQLSVAMEKNLKE